eukprot:Pgem_evm1s14224
MFQSSNDTAKLVDIAVRLERITGKPACTSGTDLLSVVIRIENSASTLGGESGNDDGKKLCALACRLEKLA